MPEDEKKRKGLYKLSYNIGMGIGKLKNRLPRFKKNKEQQTLEQAKEMLDQLFNFDEEDGSTDIAKEILYKVSKIAQKLGVEENGTDYPVTEESVWDNSPSDSSINPPGKD